MKRKMTMIDLIAYAATFAATAFLVMVGLAFVYEAFALLGAMFH